MNLVHTTIILCSVSLVTSIPIKSKQELLSVVTIFRHGDRTPLHTYPNDPYKNASYWPVDFGQLTNIGKRQHYALGRWFRKRYNGFLPEFYSDKDIYVQTTDKDRTHMSAAANLAGLYPPKGRQIWNANIPWQPIPIHTVPESDDAVLAGKKLCPLHLELLERLLKKKIFVKIDEEHKKLYEYISNHTGNNYTSFRQLKSLYDTLAIEQLYNMTLPEWTHGVFPHALFSFVVLDYILPTYNSQLARLQMGPFFYQLIDHFNAFAERTSDGRETKGKLYQKSSGGEFHQKTSAESLEKTRSEFLGKTRDEFLGKTRGEFLGETSDEFLGETRGEFLGETSDEFLGETRGELLGKIRGEFLGKTRGEFLGKTRNEFREKTSAQSHQKSSGGSRFKIKNYQRIGGDFYQKIEGTSGENATSEKPGAASRRTTSGGKWGQKFIMLSAHDGTIVNILNSLGLYEPHKPPYAGALIFEMYRGGRGEYVKIFYKNSTVPIQLTLSGCTSACSYDSFVELLKEVTLNLDDWEKECNSKYAKSI